MSPVEILRTLIFFNEDSGDIFQCDTIRHDGGLWLVPRWLESKEGWRKPERIIRIDIYGSDLSGDGGGPGFVLNHPLDREIWEGDLPPEFGGQYQIILKPDIKVPIPTTH